MEINGDVTDAGRTDGRTTNDEQGKIELLSKWMLDAEFRNSNYVVIHIGLDWTIDPTLYVIVIVDVFAVQVEGCTNLPELKTHDVEDLD